MRTKSETIAFRVDSDLMRLIDEQRHLFGISRGNWVRGIVITWLNELTQQQQTQNQTSPNSDELRALADELAALRLDIAKSAYLNLTVLGNLAPDEARQLVRKQFIRSEA